MERKLDVFTSDGTQLVHTFNMDEIKSLRTISGLFAGSKPGVGGTVAAEIDCQLLVGNVEIPRMAMLRPYVRLSDGTRVSEWLDKGVFWLDTRKTDVSTGVMSVHGYDAMLRAEQYYVDEKADIYVRVILDHNMHDDDLVIHGFDYKKIGSQTEIHHPSIAEMMGVSVNAETAATINKGYIVPFICSFLYDENTGKITKNILAGTTMTCRELLQQVAAAYCGNFIIDEYGELKLVKFPNFEKERGVIVNGGYQKITFGGVGILSGGESSGTSE